MNVLDRYILTAPDPQNALDLFRGEWSCKLPGVHASLSAGTVPTFEDGRVEWGLARLGGVQDQTVLELGPLEGGHSYMLEQAGAASIIAVEGNAHAFLKCLVVKELLGLQRTRFLCGDFVEFLGRCGERFDTAFASGVLYHMRDPLKLLALLSRVTDRLFIWTHYYDRDVVAGRPDWRGRFSAMASGSHGGYSCAYHRCEYLGALNSAQFCGGNAPYSHWMERESIVDFLRSLGFDRIDISCEQRDHPNGPAFALVAQRAPSAAAATAGSGAPMPQPRGRPPQGSQTAEPRPRSHYKEVWDALWIITFGRKPADSIIAARATPDEIALGTAPPDLPPTRSPASAQEPEPITGSVNPKATSTEVHLDCPTKLDAAEFAIQGWIISDQPIHSAKADGKPPIELKLGARADVERAYPRHKHVRGFHGQGSLANVKNGRLKLEFKVGDQHIRKFIRIAPPESGGWIAQKDKDAKFERIAPFLVCPNCHGRLQARGPQVLRCRSCRTDYRMRKRHYDFLSARLRDEFNIVETAAFSAHEYDPEVQALISRFPDGLVLDCGAGFRPTFHPNVINLEIADYPSTDVRGVNERLPFADATFDAVLSLAVLEHVKDPFACAREIIRVLKPGGIFHGVVPFLQPTHGYPRHYYNMTSQGLRNLFEPWLEIDRIEVPSSGRPIFTLTWFLNSWKHGLGPKPREEFLNLRVRDLLGDPSSYLGRSFVADLPTEVNFELASTTLLQGRRKASAPDFGAVPKAWKKLVFKLGKTGSFPARTESPVFVESSLRIGPGIPTPPLSAESVARQAQMGALAIGRSFVEHFSALGGLQPSHKVLDVGCADRSCGFGRMARALTEFLSEEGSYHGFDLCKDGITWCRANISNRFSNFHFDHADVFNSVYNSAGKISPENFQFPYPADNFDFVFLTSVFTHMLPAELEHYLDEIARVLKPGGRCFITYFLLNEDARHRMTGPACSFSFRHHLSPGCQVQDERLPESAVAYDESWIRHEYSRRNLKILEPITYGAWPGRPDAISDCQDFVIACK